MPPTSKLRRLFQALPVLSALACVLLIVLWVRSYWWKDAFYGRFSSTNWFHIISQDGRVTYAQLKAATNLIRPTILSKDLVSGLPEFHAREFSPSAQFGLYTGQVRSIRMDADMRRRMLLLNKLGQPMQRSFVGFGFQGPSGRFEIQFPYWFAVAATGVLASGAAIPWIRWRFSLRTLLVAMTLMAVVLAIIAASM